MKKIVSFGEILLRLSTEGQQRFSQAGSYRCNYGGAEFNVAMALAGYGMDSELITRLPNNELGEIALLEMRKQNVGTKNIQRGGERLGIYFLETGSGLRAGKVIYDRAHSAMATIEKGSINWQEVFSGVDWFHWSGITPAISRQAADVCLEALQAASDLGLTISVDLNYRAKLWNYGKKPAEVMPELLQYCTVMLGDLDTACFMLGREEMKPDYTNIQYLAASYDQLFGYCKNLSIAATTLRHSVHASHQKIGGLLYDGSTTYSTKLFDVSPVVDRIGSGDAFMAGLIYGLAQQEKGFQETLNFAVSACCLKHSIQGDYNLATIEEIENLASGNSSAIVNR